MWQLPSKRKNDNQMFGWITRKDNRDMKTKGMIGYIGNSKTKDKLK